MKPLLRLLSLGMLGAVLVWTPVAAQAETLPGRSPEASQLFVEGSELLSKGSLDEAEAKFLEAIALNPDMDSAQYNLGLIYQQKQDWPKALLHLRKASWLNPHKANTHFLLGITLLNTNEKEKARESFEEALKLNPELGAVHHSLGALDYRDGDFHNAITHLEKAVKIAPNSVNTLYILGMSYIRAGQSEMAIGVITELRRLKGETLAKSLEAFLRDAGQLEVPRPPGEDDFARPAVPEAPEPPSSEE